MSSSMLVGQKCTLMKCCDVPNISLRLLNPSNDLFLYQKVVNHLKYTANVCYNESIEGFGSVVTQVQNLSPKTPFGEFLLYKAKNYLVFVPKLVQTWA